NPRISICWATTYTFEPGFFESFLLRRLGDPPLNAVVIGDFTRLSALWQQLEPRGSRLRAANRRYLIRGASIAGAFHAKTILLGRKDQGTLFVGSGNLGLLGVEQGREVFTRFDSTNERHLPAFRAWRVWMNDVVASINDGALRSRFANLLGQAEWLAGSPARSQFITNWRAPLIDGLCAGRWSEIHITAPFFDAELRALKEVVRRTRASRIVLYLGKDASVDGKLLAEFGRVKGQDLVAYALEPSTYVH